jgi:hypothetical protein
LPVGHLVGELDKLAVLDGFTHQKMEAAEDPHLAVLVAEHEPAQPLARLLGAPLPVENSHVLAAANDAEIVGIFSEVPRELAIRELVVHDDLVHGKRQGLRELPDELPVLAFIGRLEEVAPQRLGHGAESPSSLLFDDVQRGGFRPGAGTRSSATRW